MGHYVKVENNIVTHGIVVEQDYIDKLSNEQWIQTSYNIRGGVYYDPLTNLPVEDQSVIKNSPGRMRKNYAGIGFTYDETKDAFIPPKPYPSWQLNAETCLWETPVPYPDDNNIHNWNEESQTWNEIKNNIEE